MMQFITSIRDVVKNEFRDLWIINKTDRVWHFPALAGVSVATAVFLIYFFYGYTNAMLGCIGGIVSLQMPKGSISRRMNTLIICSFGYVFSMAVGLVFSQFLLFTPLVLALFAFATNYLVNKFKLPPPGNFFFIVIAAMALGMPFNLEMIPMRMGMVAMGTLSTVLIAFLYCLLLDKKSLVENHKEIRPRWVFGNLSTSITVGVVVGISLLVGVVFNFHKPYWLAISAIAIIQGSSVRHVWQRSKHRILGTMVGLCLSYFLFKLSFNPIYVILTIAVLQFIIEMLIVRHYALSVVFITPMTLLMAESASVIAQNSSTDLLHTRFIDIMVGSLIGLIGGYFLHHQKIQAQASRRMRTLFIATNQIQRIRKRPARN
ncbi:FUSC family protein [Pedobacter sp. MW01-1-1]|uniref:FUSC family protein n=1 Tax=Pedobacter sp. MW01-1-1 TaxID=3383027 RepID=UPI003FEF3A12